MRKYIEATIFSALTVVFAAGVAAAVLPGHPRATEEAPAQTVVLAVSVSGAEDSAEASACPYLAALAAASACPAKPKASDSTGCPFMDGKAKEESQKSKKKLTGQHT